MLAEPNSFPGSSDEPEGTFVPFASSDGSVAQLPPSPRATFASRFCVQRGIALDAYEDAVLAVALYPLAAQLRTLLGLIPGYFDADREFVAAVGRATKMEDVEFAMSDFIVANARRGVLRRVFRLRVSASKLWWLAGHMLGEPRVTGAYAAMEGGVAATRGGGLQGLPSVYDDETKREGLRRWETHVQAAEATARELGVPVSEIYKWKRESQAKTLRPGRSFEALESDATREREREMQLREELARLDEQRAMIRKLVAPSDRGSGGTRQHRPELE